MKNRKLYSLTFRLVVTVLLFILLIPAVVEAQTTVGTDGLTQAVIDGAAAGDILVLTGNQTLATTLVFDKDITIKGQGTTNGMPVVVIKQTGTGRHFTSSTADITINFENVALIGPNADYAGGVVTSNDDVASGGGIVSTQATSTINVSNCIIAGCRATTVAATVTATGGGISAAGPLTVSNSSILHNTTNAANGGGIYAVGLLTLSGNNTFSYNKTGWTGTAFNTTTAYHGGGIYAANGLTLKDALVCNGNGATGDGGGIYKSATGVFTATELTSLELDGNGAGLGGATVPGNGGGLYTAADLTLENLISCTISNNTAKPYKVNTLDSRGGGGGIYAGKTLVLKNAVIDNNSVAGTVTGNGNVHFPNRGAGGGGGIFTAGDATLENVTVINNTSTTTQNNYSTCGGGGICVAAKLTLKDATVRNNTSSTVGGGIFTVFASTLNNVVVNNNQAGTNGGGIYAASTLALNKSTVDRNRAESDGGGIYTALTQTAFSMAPTLNSSTVTNNSAGSSGGGVYALAHLALRGTNTISDNKAGWTGTTYRSTGHGGGIYSYDLTLYIADTLICKKNTAGGYGGGIYKTSISGTGLCVMTVTDLKQLQLEENESKYAGGGIYSTVLIDFSKLPKGSSISGNRAGTFGGGVCVGSTSGTSDHLSVIKLSNLTIHNNTALQHGGGIYAPGPLTLSGENIISNNKAGYNATTQTFSGTFYGGGIYTKAGLTLIDTLVCKGNVASSNGGGIYKVNSFSTTNPYYPIIFNVAGLKLLQVDGNEAKAAGGGIYTADILDLGKLLEGSSISGNTAKTAGGGIYTSEALTLNNTVVKNNAAGSSSGGGIYAGSAVTLANVTVNNNTAGTTGGGIYATGALSLSGNDTISYNKAGYDATTGAWKTAANNGGGIYASNNLILKDTLVCNGNIATGAGGGIWKSTTGTTTFAADELALLEVSGNTAGYNVTAAQIGGGIYAGVALDLSKLKQGFVSKNTASSSGGGIYAASALALNNSAISGNKAGYNSNTMTWAAAGNGGGIYAGSTLVLKGDIVCDRDSASQHGGGIYISANAGFTTTDLQSLTITNCSADAGKSSATYGNGGAVCFSGGNAVSANTGNLSITFGKSGVPVLMTGNRASQGGAIFLTANNAASSTTSLTIQNAVFSDNTSWGSGGAIWLGGNNATTAPNMPVTLTDVKFSGNTGGWDYKANTWSTNSGGGLQLDNNKIDLILKGAVIFENNRTAAYGGAVCTNSATGSITGAKANGFTSLEITGNAARAAGGGIFTGNAGMSVALEGATIKNNAAIQSGGGIYANGALTLAGSNTISDNKAGWNGTAFTTTAYYGGGIYAGNNLTLSGTFKCINNAASSSGGGIYKSSSTATINATGLNLLQLNNNAAGKSVSGSGGGAYLAGSATVGADFSNVASVEIDRNTASGNGGGIYSTGTLSFKNTIIRNNTAGSNGGAIYVSAPLTLDDMTISGNKAGWNGTAYSGAGDGGGVYAANSLVLKGNIVFDRDSAFQHGGGIFKGSGVFDVSGITSLKISNGAAVNNNGNGGGIYTSVSISFPNGISAEIKNNKAGGFGGGIYTNAAVTLSNFTVSENRSGSHGGGIYANAALTMNNMTISGNISGGSGGGIQSGPSAALVFNNVDIAGNSAMGNGGGVFAGNALTLNTTNVLNNKAGYNALTGIWTATLVDGGGIYAGTDLTLQGAVVFMNDTTTQHGGAIYKNTNSAFNTAAMTSLKVYNSQATKGTGGGIHTQASINCPDNITVEISGNTAGTSGGGIYAATYDVTLSNLTVSNNKANTNGGGIYSTNNLTLNNITTSGNESNTNGGGIYAANALTLNNSVISNNKAGYNSTTDTWQSASNGGGVYVTNAITLMGNVSFEGNMTGGGGGGIWKNTNASFTGTGLASLKINTNTAIAGHGGGAYFTGNYNGTTALGPVDLSNASVEITDNKAGGDGGGVYNGSMLTLKNAVVLNNKAGYDGVAGNWLTTGNGGGIATGDLTAQGYLTVENNEAANSGGGIHKSGGTSSILVPNMTSLKLNLNTARTGSGGGIWTNAALNLPRTAYAEITNNKANVNGGGIYTSAPLTLNNSLVSENKAKDGGGIYVTGILNSINNTFSQNVAEAGTGGAVHASANANISFTTLNGNTASTNTGNAIYFNNAAGKTLNGNIIYGNGTGSEINVAPATANYNIVRGMNLGATNRNVAIGKADSIFAIANNATDLATLADNGGPTQTLDIKRNGYAYNLIPNNIAASWTSITTDQRGEPRPSGCKTDAGAVELQVGAQQNPDVTIPEISNACTGDEVEFSAQATGSGKLSYLWSATPDGTITDNGTAQESFTWNIAGIKTVKLTVTDSENCDVTATTEIEINLRPKNGLLHHVPNWQ